MITKEHIETITRYVNRTLASWKNAGKTNNKIVNDVKSLYLTKLHETLKGVYGWESVRRMRLKNRIDIIVQLNSDLLIEKVYLYDNNEEVVKANVISEIRYGDPNIFYHNGNGVLSSKGVTSLIQSLLAEINYIALIEKRVDNISEDNTNGTIKEPENVSITETVTVSDVRFDAITAITF